MRVAERTTIGNNRDVLQSAFPIVVFGAVALSVVMSIVFLFSRGSLYDQIGDSGFSTELDAAPEEPPPAGSSAERDEQEREIRQMLGARSERLVRSGQPPLDVDAELARLLEGERDGRDSNRRDAGLVAEVRQLVIARNERRARQGMAPLDVDGEVARTLAELEP